MGDIHSFQKGVISWAVNNNKALCQVDWKERMQTGINIDKESEAKEE